MHTIVNALWKNWPYLKEYLQKHVKLFCFDFLQLVPLKQEYVKKMPKVSKGSI